MIERTYKELVRDAALCEGDFVVTDAEAHTIIGSLVQGLYHRLDKMQNMWMSFITGQAKFYGRPMVPKNKTEWFGLGSGISTASTPKSHNWFYDYRTKNIGMESNYKLFSKRIKIKQLDPRAKLPTYAHGPEEDAGMDLYALEDVLLREDQPTLVSTGLSIELPPGYEGQIRGRSSLAYKHGIIVPNAPGTVDPGYRGEVKVLLLWGGYQGTRLREYASFDEFGVVRKESEWVYEIHAGDRIAQLVIAQYQPVEWEVVDVLANSTRGEGGLGSTGM